MQGFQQDSRPSAVLPALRGALKGNLDRPHPRGREALRRSRGPAALLLTSEKKKMKRKAVKKQKKVKKEEEKKKKKGERLGGKGRGRGG